MNKEDVEKMKKEIEAKFAEVSKQAEQFQVEMVKLQGEHRLVSKILSEFKEEKKD